MTGRLLLPLFLTLGLVATSLAETPKEAIQKRYDELSQLEKKKDAQALEKAYRLNAASNFMYVDLFQNTYDIDVSVAQYVKQLDRVEDYVQNSNTITDIRRDGLNYVCTVKTVLDAFLDPDHKRHLQGVSISEDIWTNTIAGWKMLKSHVTKESAKMNGKPIISKG
ncbi:MAG: hypothetical protein JST12_07655 [Armatimonadetes bacterium]|nr:hypothetical protein [Armatimonadota bacterium]MBS1701519.1 hypothetical protein [Armatimonadota bacterium]